MGGGICGSEKYLSQSLIFVTFVQYTMFLAFKKDETITQSKYLPQAIKSIGAPT